MLHILWMILKLILIFLGILLGLIVLLLLALLFVPVCYRVSGKKKEAEQTARGTVTWLFRAVSVTAAYENGAFQKEVRLLGISLFKVKAWLDCRRAAKEQKKKAKSAPKAVRQSQAEGRSRSLPGMEAQERKKQSPSLADTAPKEIPKPDEAELLEQREPAGQMQSAAPPLLWERVTAYLAKGLQILRAVFRGIGSVFGKLWQLLRFLWGIPGRILQTIKKFTYTIGSFCDKINYWKAFLTEERTKAAIALVKRELWRLLRHIRPRKLKGHVTFGFADPSLTGQVTAGLGMTYPLHRNRVQFVPVFDRSVLEGEIQCRGSIYGIALVITAWRLYFDKNIKYVWNRWNQKEG